MVCWTRWWTSPARAVACCTWSTGDRCAGRDRAGCRGRQARAHPGLPSLQQEALPRLMADARATMQPANGRMTAAELEAIGLDAGLASYATLALPLRDRREQLLGMLLLFRTARSMPPTPVHQALAASAAHLAGNAGTAARAKTLLEATIHAYRRRHRCAEPYTGGHCERVPERPSCWRAPRARRRTNRPASAWMPRNGKRCTSAPGC